MSCVAVGDVFNKKKNSLVILTADGWCYIYNAPETENTVQEEDVKPGGDVSGVYYFNFFLLFCNVLGQWRS